MLAALQVGFTTTILTQPLTTKISHFIGGNFNEEVWGIASKFGGYTNTYHEKVRSPLIIIKIKHLNNFSIIF